MRKTRKYLLSKHPMMNASKKLAPDTNSAPKLRQKNRT